MTYRYYTSPETPPRSAGSHEEFLSSLKVTSVGSAATSSETKRHSLHRLPHRSSSEFPGVAQKSLEFLREAWGCSGVSSSV